MPEYVIVNFVTRPAVIGSGYGEKSHLYDVQGYSKWL
jgi:hypothetical protein